MPSDTKPAGDGGWGVYLGALYLETEAADDTLGIDVNPTLIQIGFGKSF